MERRQRTGNGDITVLGLFEICMFNGDSELTVIDAQGKCYNNLKQNLGSGIVQTGVI
jgi:hypothetical protein